MKSLKNKIASIEISELGKLILGLILLIILIWIVTIAIGGEFGNQQDKIGNAFKTLK